MIREFGGYRFQLVGRIEPDRDSNGAIRQFMPQARYRNAGNLSLNKHGPGPFCRFSIARGIMSSGVYIVTVAGKPVYVGKCQSLAQRFGAQGYGAIQPRNCFVGGQSTNCKINHLILECGVQQKPIELWFHPTPNAGLIERDLIVAIRPPWNHQTPW